MHAHARKPSPARVSLLVAGACALLAASSIACSGSSDGLFPDGSLDAGADGASLPDSSTGPDSTTGADGGCEPSCTADAGLDAAPGADATATDGATGADATANDGATDADASVADGGIPADAGDEADAAATDAGGDAGNAMDGSPLGPPGTQLTAGDDLTVWGVTSDGYVAYYDHVNARVGAVSLSGGSPQVVTSSAGANFEVFTIGKTIAVWTNLDARNVGGLTVWTAADGPHTLSSASVSGWAAVDDTGDFVVYTSNVNESAATCDLLGSRNDGTLVTTLLGGVSAPPNLAFGISGPYAVVNWGSSAVDGGLATQLSSFAIPTWIRTDLTSPAPGWGALQALAGGEALYVDPANDVEVYPVAGGTPSVVGASSTTLVSLLTPDGKDVLFVPPGQASIDRSPVSTPSATVLATGTTLSPETLSPNAATFLTYGGTAPNENLLMGSATTPGALTTVASATNLGNVSFTSDSSYVVYETGYAAPTYVGTLTSMPVSGGAARVIDTGVALWEPATQSKIVFDDDYMTTTADLKAVDLAQSAAPTLVVAGAHSGWALSPAKDKLIFSWSQQLGPAAGIYVVDVP